ncbi:hypothetical protein BDZ89DRAFT_1081511 [Hymenopellis radicata]|nr:hypothetical protein BDZ89DRAFT_1081511 [Hymenopellis radicata]
MLLAVVSPASWVWLGPHSLQMGPRWLQSFVARLSQSGVPMPPHWSQSAPSLVVFVCRSSLVESCSLPVVVGRVSLLVGSSRLGPRRAWLAPLAPRVWLLVSGSSCLAPRRAWLAPLAPRISLLVGHVLLFVARASSFDRSCGSLIRVPLSVVQLECIPRMGGCHRVQKHSDIR